MMICLAIVGVMTGFGVSLFNRQIAELQLRRVVHAFIQDAQLSRQYSRSKMLKSLFVLFRGMIGVKAGKSRKIISIKII